MPRRLRIATFNLENLDDPPQGGGDYADRLAILRPQLLRLRADVLCLQEVNARDRHGERSLAALDHLLGGSGYEDYHRIASLNRGGKHFADHHNLVILSRFPAISEAQIWHDLVPPPRHGQVDGGDEMAVEWDRPLQHAVLRLDDGARLNVLNLHLRAPRAAFLQGHKDHGVWSSVAGWAEGFYLAAIKGAGQALEARLVVEQIFDADPQALVAVCGDLNSGDRETPVRILRGDVDDTANGHLAARALVPVERSLSLSQRHSVIHHGHPLMLDHILVSRPLLGWFIAAELHNEALGDELVSPQRISGPPDSYHAPLVAEFAPPSRPRPKGMP